MRRVARAIQTFWMTWATGPKVFGLAHLSYFSARGGLKCCVALCLALPWSAQAGNQQYEPLADAVRLALIAKLEDRATPQPLFKSTDQRIRWLTEMSRRLERKIPDYRTRMDFIKTLRYEAQRAGLDPQLMFALVQVESGFNRTAVSPVGARGYTQVMPFWTKLLANGDPDILFDMRTSLRFGCVILRHYLDMERGDMFRALGRYNGSLGKPEYPGLVFGALRQNWLVE